MWPGLFWLASHCPRDGRGLTEDFHMVVLCRFPQLVGDHTGVLASIFLLSVQDLETMGTCLGSRGQSYPETGLHHR